MKGMFQIKNILKSPCLSFLFRIYFKLGYVVYNDRKYARKRYRKVYGRELNLDSPQFFHEKLQWLKLNDRRSLLTQCADKLQVRKYVEETIGGDYLIPLLGTFDSSRELEPNNLPDVEFIIKCNHNSGAYTIVKNKEVIDWKIEKNLFSNLLKQNYYFQGREWQYKNIKPTIIVEKLLMEEDGSIPFDYKIFCFNGKVELIQVDLDRQGNHSRNLYDTDWNLLPFEYCYSNGREVKKPNLLGEMITLTEKLAGPFAFARIDWYNCNGKIYFGEITFHPEGGFGKFNDEEVELSLGNKLNIN